MLKDKLSNAITDNNMGQGWIFLYFYDQVIIGRFSNDSLFFSTDNFDEKLCFEIHIFNKDKELRSTNGDDFCLILDSGEDLFLEEKLFFLGNKVTMNEDNTISTLSQYGRSISIPGKFEPNKTRLVIHHLFDKENGNLIGYRLVDIEGGA